MDKSPKIHTRFSPYIIGILILGIIFLGQITVTYAQETIRRDLAQELSDGINDTTIKYTNQLTDTLTTTPTVTLTETPTPTSTETPTVTGTPTVTSTLTATPTDTSTITTTPTNTSTHTPTSTSTNTPSPTDTLTSTPTGTTTATATVTSSSTSTATSTTTPTVTGTPPTRTPTPTVTGTLSIIPSVKVSVQPSQAKINENFTFAIEVGNNGTGPIQNNIVLDAFPTYIDVLTVTTSRGTITKLAHSFVVTIGEIVPTEKITIVAGVKVNSTLSRTETVANVVTLTYDVSKSITASVNYKVVYQTLPPTGELPLNSRDAQVNLISIIPSILLISFGAIIIIFGIWTKFVKKQNVLWIIPVGTLLILIGFVFGVTGTGLLTSIQQSNGYELSPTAGGILAQLYPIEPSETNLPRLPAAAFSTPEDIVPFATLPDYPIPTPEITVTPQPGEPEPDISPVVRIVIPGIFLDTEVKYVPYDGNSWMINGLRQEVAWMGNTSWPGLGSNTALAGHVTVAGVGDGPFRHLDELLTGEVVILYTEENMYTYQVRESLVTDDGNMSVTQDSEEPQITLITCVDWDQDTRTYLKRLIVFADLVRTEPITMGFIP